MMGFTHPTPTTTTTEYDAGMSIAMMMFLQPFKDAAADGAVVELKLRLLAGSIPALQQHALEQKLQEVESRLIDYFSDSLSDEEKATLCLCRQLRNKVLHADFHNARRKLRALGVETSSGGVKKVDIPIVTVPAITEKFRSVQAGTEGSTVADTSSTAAGTVYGWFLEAGQSGDFQKASEIFKRATIVIDRLAGMSFSNTTLVEI